MKKSRDEWGEGPWQNEPDKAQWVDQKTGLTCRALRNPDVGTWCGYVGVTPHHDLFGIEANDWESPADLACHGGVTFAGFWKGDDKGLWWIGFDCAHAMDYMPAFPQLGDRGHYRTLKYVRAECAHLAMQIFDLDSGEDEEAAIEELPL